jgi:hypothetical protein
LQVFKNNDWVPSNFADHTKTDFIPYPFSSSDSTSGLGNLDDYFSFAKTQAKNILGLPLDWVIGNDNQRGTQLNNHGFDMLMAYFTGLSGGAGRSGSAEQNIVILDDYPLDDYPLNALHEIIHTYLNDTEENNYNNEHLYYSPVWDCDYKLKEKELFIMKSSCYPSVFRYLGWNLHTNIDSWLISRISHYDGLII